MRIAAATILVLGACVLPPGDADRCAGLTADRCAASAGCVADVCFACSCTPAFAGCRALDAEPHACPLLGCPQPLCCHGDQDCAALSLACVSAGDPPACGACDVTPGSCTADTSCGAGMICEPIRCSCDDARACGAGCRAAGADACSLGTACDAATDRCVPRACDADVPCPPDFDCRAGHCERRSCSDDRVCDGACVDGTCQAGLGECRPASA